MIQRQDDAPARGVSVAKILAVAAVALAACAPHLVAKSKPTDATARRRDEGATSASSFAVPAAEPLPVGKPGWKTIPTAQQGFWVALDGLCSMLEVQAVGRDALASYGGATEPMFATDAKTRIGHASFIALRERGLESIGVPDVAMATAVAGTSLDDFWIADSTGGRMGAPAVLHWRHNGAWSRFDEDLSNLHPWVDGGVLGITSYVVWNGRDIVTKGTNTVPPLALYDGYQNPPFTSFATGDVTLIVYASRGSGDAMLHARQWSTSSKKITETPLAMLDAVTTPTLFMGVAADEIYVATGRKLALYDGSTWRLVAVASKDLAPKGSRRASKGVVWAVLEDGSIVTNHQVWPANHPVWPS